MPLVELAPCPFCGGYAEFERMGSPRNSCVVVCQECGCRLESNEGYPNSGKQWNARVRPSPVAWIVKWTQKSIPPEHASAYLSEDEATRAAANIERYADVSNVVVIPAFPGFH